MNIRVIGAVIIVLSSGWVGFQMVSSYKREEKLLEEMLHLLNLMEWELSYHLTPLPDLCMIVSSEGKSLLHRIFRFIADELEKNTYADVDRCIRTALKNISNLPPSVYRLFYLLGSSLGRFDLDGQLNGLRAVKAQCENELRLLTENKDVRLRSYQTLSLCAGAAVAILLI